MTVFASGIRRKFTPYIPLLVYVAIAVLIALAGFQGFRKIENMIEVEKLNDLGLIADLKIGQIVSWQDGHRKQAQIFSSGALLATEFEQWLKKGEPSDGQEQKLLRVLAGLQLTHGYTTVSLLDRQGVVKIVTGKVDTLDGADMKLVLEAVNSRQPVFSDIHRSGHEGQAVTLSIAAPLIDANVKNGHVVGVILLHIDPYDFLYPLIQSWPSPSPSAETVLTRQEGSEVVFINELRHRKGAALSLRIPVTMSNLPTVMAIHGETSAMNGADYRGVPVVAAMRRVPGTSWFMISKVDRVEIFAPINQLKTWVVGLGLAIAVFVGFFFFVWLRGVHALQNQLKAEHDAALERELLLQHIEYLTRYANDMIIVANEVGQIVEANERAQQTLGYSREELLHMRIVELHGSLDSPTIPGKLETLKQEGSLRVEGIYQRKDGSTFPVEISARVIEAQGTRYLQGIIRDITERKHAEKELRLQRNFIYQIVDTDPNLITVKDAEGKLLLVNRAMAVLHGLRPEELVGRTVALFPFKEEAGPYLITDREVIEARRQVESVTHDFLNGRECWFHVTKVPMEQPDGTVHVLGIGVDITEHKQFEELRAKMEHVGRLNVAGEMASGMAHELSQPLTACANYLHGCLRRMDENIWDRKNLHMAVSLAHKQAERAGQIINHLKELVRKQGHERALIDINLLVREVCGFLEDEIKRQGISLSMTLFPLPQVMACRVEIEQVLLNLYKNAIESMHSCPQRELRVSTRTTESGDVLVVVSDTGRGISAAEMAGLFNPFQTSKQDGLGLGLAICRTFVENHSGRIWVSPQRELGAEFCFTLPVGGAHE